jgi:hypothetical protein
MEALVVLFWGWLKEEIHHKRPVQWHNFWALLHDSPSPFAAAVDFNKNNSPLPTHQTSLPLIVFCCQKWN